MTTVHTVHCGVSVFYAQATNAYISNVQDAELIYTALVIPDLRIVQTKPVHGLNGQRRRAMKTEENDVDQRFTEKEIRDVLTEAYWYASVPDYQVDMVIQQMLKNREEQNDE